MSCKACDAEPNEARHLARGERQRNPESPTHPPFGERRELHIAAGSAAMANSRISGDMAVGNATNSAECLAQWSIYSNFAAA